MLVLAIKEQDARKLSPEQQETLRMTAVRMVFEEGYLQREAARAVGVTRQEVNAWCRKYEKGGWEALKAKKRGRKPGEQQWLQPWQCATIVTLISDHMPDQLKLPFVLWTRAAVRDLISERFEITLSLSAMSNYLKRLFISTLISLLTFNFDWLAVQQFLLCQKVPSAMRSHFYAIGQQCVGSSKVGCLQSK